MSKILDTIKGNQERPGWKSSHQKLREAKAKLAEAQAAGNIDLAQSLTRWIACLQARFTRRKS